MTRGRCRKGSAKTARGALRFVEELIPRVARAGATGPKLLRADSGFRNRKTMARLEAAAWTYSIGVRQQKHIQTAILAIAEQDWIALDDCPETGQAQIAQTMLGHQRLVVRRTRLLGIQLRAAMDSGQLAEHPTRPLAHILVGVEPTLAALFAGLLPQG